MKIRHSIWIVLIILTTVLSGTGPLDLFWEGRYHTLGTLFPQDRLSNLSDEHKSLLLEALCLSGDREKALETVAALYPTTKEQDLPLSLRMAMTLSKGELIPDHPLFTQSTKDPRCLFYTFLYALQCRQFSRSEAQLTSLCDILQSQNPYWHYAMRYRAITLLAPWLDSLTDHCRKLVQLAKQLKNSSLEKNAADLNRFYRPLQGHPAFVFTAKEDEVRLPLNYDPHSGHFTIGIKIDGRDFTVLLDTGNAEGWMIHSMDLLMRTKTRLGLRRRTQIGTAGKTFSSQSCLTPVLPVSSETLENLTGVFIPQPGKNLYDANLNPTMIKNRIVTIDTVGNEFILQSLEHYKANDPVRSRDLKKTVYPWLGFQYILLRQPTLSDPPLLLIETGASGITLRKRYADQQAIFGSKNIRHETNGDILRFDILPFGINMGDILIADSKTEIWPLDEYFLRFSGIKPDIILGPNAFRGRIQICLNPFRNELSLMTRQCP